MKRSTMLIGMLLLAATPLSASAGEGAGGGASASALPVEDAATALDTTVEEAWMADTAIPGYLLAAKLRDGKLQLFGAVENAKQRDAAVATAHKLAGDTPVESHIEVLKIASLAGTPAVGSGGPTSVPAQDVSTALAATVEEAWIANGKIPYPFLAAKVRSGKLQLFGAVETAEERASAVEIAKKQAGDVPVVSHIAVRKMASLAP